MFIKTAKDFKFCTKCGSSLMFTRIEGYDQKTGRPYHYKKCPNYEEPTFWKHYISSHDKILIHFFKKEGKHK